MLQSQPIIRWAGSKRKLLPILKSNLPKHYDRYVEPFCGSASLFFEQSQNKALLADINGELINAFTQIKNNNEIRELAVSLPNTSEKYYEMRSLDPENLNETERAVRFLYLNRYCFNGVYRTNKAGRFNVPRGSRTGGFPDKNVFNMVRKKLLLAELIVSDYSDTMTRLKKGDFVYIDPPYTKTGKNTGEYGPNSFKSDRIPEFISYLAEIDRKEVKFLLSYRACSETIQLLSNHYHIEYLSVKRHISGFKKNWGDAQEILVKNYES